jgi:hypothetical protein
MYTYVLALGEVADFKEQICEPAQMPKRRTEIDLIISPDIESQSFFTKFLLLTGKSSPPFFMLSITIYSNYCIN